MPNKSSPHGGFISQGTVIHGTMRTQDLLRAFAAEYERVLPFNSSARCYEARELADAIDANPDGQVALMNGDEAVSELAECLQEIAARESESLYFGTHPGDSSDWGYWESELDDATA